MFPHSRRRLRRLTLTLTTVVTTLGLTLTAASAAQAQELGIDVSKWQHNPSINWGAVKNDGVKFAFIKATEGVGYTSAPFKADWAATKQVGIYRGAYHFARPGTNAGDAAAEARYFVSVAGKHQGRGDLPPVLDLESTGGLSPTQLRAWTKTWLTTVEKLTGRTPIIYVSPSFWESYLGNSRDFTRYPLWVAHYGVRSPRVPGGWQDWTFWQGTSTGRVAGISGDVDKNAFHGTLRQLKRLANITVAAPAPAPAPEPEPEPEPETPTVPDTAPDLTRSTATLSVNRASVYPGQSVTLTGTVADTTGAPGAARRVTVRHRPPGGTWHKVAVATTESTGGYRVTVDVPGPGAYRTVVAATATHTRAASAPVEVAVRPKAATRVTFTSPRDSIRNGRTVRLYGHLTTADGAALPAKTVRILKKRPGTSTWRPVGRATSVAPTGWHQFRVTPRTTMVYKAVYRGGLRYTRSTSAPVRVTVRRR